MGWLQNLFRKVPKEPSSPYNGQGVGGVTQIGNQRPDSNERNARLADPRQRALVYDEISQNTAIVATGLRYFSALVTGIKWQVKPAKDTTKKEEGAEKPVPVASPRSEEIAKLIQENMKHMDIPWFKVVRRAASFKWSGANIQEMIARRFDDLKPGFIGVGTIEPRPMATIEEWYLEDRSNEVLGWGQRDPNTQEILKIDRNRCIYIADDTLTNSPEGTGLLRHVVELCDQLRRLEQLEGWAYETDLRGIPLGRAPTAILDEMVQRNQLTRAQADDKLRGITNFIESHFRSPELGILLDSSLYTTRDAQRSPSTQKMWDLELLKGSGAGLSEICAAIERKQHEIARALGIEQFMLGAANKGSLALSEDKTRNLIELINATVKEVAWILQKDYIGFIFAVNKWPKKMMPELMPDAVALRSVSVIVEVLSKLALAGATIDRNDPVINQIRGMLELVDQPFVTEEMKMETKAPNSGGTPGEKAPNKPTEKKDK